MRRTYWYHEECLSQVETAVRTSKSPHHEICARCGYEGACVEAELVTNPDTRAIGEELKKAAEALSEVELEGKPAEVKEAVLDAVEEALEEATEVEEQLKESPEETAPAEAVEPIAEEVVAESPEVAEKAAKIEALRAQLAELEK